MGIFLIQKKTVNVTKIDHKITNKFKGNIKHISEGKLLRNSLIGKLIYEARGMNVNYGNSNNALLQHVNISVIICTAYNFGT